MRLPNLTNYDDHPTEPGWLVFRFATPQQADAFEQGLRDAGIRHERDTEGGPPYLVAARQAQREPAVRINYRVLGRYRKPFLADPVLRWGVLGLLALLVALAVAGALLRA